ncbi:MAG: TetR/AcrR family transcriptional regulator [Planctomycetota bacterium]|nr:TetR/AcrR family transcriptional regulator [Planctomycetota bacterium]
MPPADRRAREKAAARGKILSAARDLFVRDGLEHVTMRRIADAAEYTAPALYVHFPDKDALIEELCRDDCCMLREAFGVAECIADPVERLLEIGRAYVRFALDHPHHYRFMFMTPKPPPPEAVLSTVRDNPDLDGYAFMRQAVSECIRAGRFKPGYRDPERVAQICWAAAHSVASLYIIHGTCPWVRWRDPLETAYRLLEAVTDGMLAPGDARKGVSA